MCLQKIVFVQPTDITRRAFNDIGEETAGAVFFNHSLHHVSAIGAPFGHFDEGILFSNS